MKVINRFYKTSQTDKELKIYVFKILDLTLSLQVESPGDRDAVKWNRLLADCMEKVESEINFLDSKYQKYKSELITSGVFIEFAATAASCALWDDTFMVSFNQSCDSSHVDKRQRVSDKFQYLTDRIDIAETDKQKSSVNFRWLQVIAIIIKRNPTLVSFDDYAALLEITNKCQQNIHNFDQQKSFHLLIESLISCEPIISAQNKLVNEWNTLCDNVFKGTTVTSKFCKKNLILLALLVRHKKYKSNAFVQNILEAIFSYSTIKVDETLRLICIILIHFNINLLDHSLQIPKQIMGYLFPVDHTARSIMTFKSKLDSELQGKVIVLTCLSKTKLKENVAEKWSINLLKENLKELECDETET